MISLGLDGRLEQKQKSVLDRHLTVCSSCREWQDLQFRMASWLERPFTESLSPFFATKVLGLVSEKKALRWYALPMGLGVMPRKRSVLMTVLFLLALMAGLRIGSEGNNQTQSEQSMLLCDTLQMGWFSDQPAASFGKGLNGLMEGDIP